MKEKVKQIMLEAMTASPGRLSEIVVDLSGYYAFIAGQLDDILVFKPSRWIEMRKEQGSDKSTDRAWDATEEGQKEIKLRGEIKSLEKFISACKLRLRVKEGESRNLY